MRTIVYLQKRGFLTEMQVMVAYQFSRAPNQFHLAPSLFRVLHDVVIREKALQQIETEKGWPVRSAKQIVSLLLTALLECRGDTLRAGHDPATLEAMTNQIAFLTGDDPKRQLDVMREFGFTQLEARIWLIMQNAPNQEITNDVLQRRLEADRDEDYASSELIKTKICHMRKKIADTRYSIETMWGVGYRIKHKSIASDTHLSGAIDMYVANVIHGQSMRAIARAHGVEPSTVLRSIRKVEDLRDDPEFDQIIDRATAKAADPARANRSSAA